MGSQSWIPLSIKMQFQMFSIRKDSGILFQVARTDTHAAQNLRDATVFARNVLAYIAIQIRYESLMMVRCVCRIVAILRGGLLYNIRGILGFGEVVKFSLGFTICGVLSVQLMHFNVSVFEK